MIKAAKNHQRRGLVFKPGCLTEAEGGRRDLTRLPALYRNEINRAHDPGIVGYMKSWMQPQNLGYLVAFLRLGFIVQYVGENLCRCVQVADDERSLLFLAKHTESLHAAGGRMQLFPYTVVVDADLFAFQNNMVYEEAGVRIPFSQPVEAVQLQSMEVA